MTETPESRTEPTGVATKGQLVEPSPSRWERPSSLGRIAAWVGIVAGVVFIVAVIFFSGFVVGSDGYIGRTHRGDGHWMHHGGQPQMGPGMMGPGSMGPGQIGPGQMGPGQMGPGQMGPGQDGPQPAVAYNDSGHPLSSPVAESTQFLRLPHDHFRPFEPGPVALTHGWGTADTIEPRRKGVAHEGQGW